MRDGRATDGGYAELAVCELCLLVKAEPFG